MPIISDVGTQDYELVVTNQVANIGINIKDENGLDITPEELSVSVYDVCGAELFTDIYAPAVDRTPNPPRILNPYAGRYELPLGLDNGSTDPLAKNKTNIRRDLLITWKFKQSSSTYASLIVNPGTGVNSVLKWTAITAGSPGTFISVEYINPNDVNQPFSINRDGAKIQVNLATNSVGVVTTTANDIINALSSYASAAAIVSVALATGSDGTAVVAAFSQTPLTGGIDGSEEESLCINTKIITPRICSLIGKLRLEIDKAIKYVRPSGDLEESCYLGYTEGQLVQYLEGGLQAINAYQPSGYFTFENYPYNMFSWTLIEASLMVGVISQQLFAVDTDIPNWSDQGNAFVIQHQPQLAAFLNWISQRLDKMIPQMKLNFVSSGSLHIEAGPNFRLAQLINAAPSGALFRNTFFKS